MYKLTERRLDLAEQILERFRSEIAEVGHFHARSLEHELRDVWEIGYQELKDIMLDIYKNHERYKYVAVYYMEHSNVPGVVTEFKRTLANAYGISHYHSDDREDAQKAFWEAARRELSQNNA